MRSTLVALTLLCAACTKTGGNGYAVNLAVTLDSTVTAEALARIDKLSVTVSGAESFNKTFPVANQLGSRKLTLIYRPALKQPGTDEFVVVGSDDAGPIAAGLVTVEIVPNQSKTINVTLSSFSLVDNDGGDGGSDGVLAPPKKQGEACAAGVDVCESGFCVDGVCCNSACTDACLACNLPDKAGTCTPIADGEPPSHGSCPALAPDDLTTKCSTDGKCDGAGACRRWPAGTVCGAGLCDSATNEYTRPSLCDTEGRCIPQGKYNCSPYVCDGPGGCFSVCSGDAQCCNDSVNPARCANQAVNTCVSTKCGKLPQGRDCAQTDDCSSGLFCVDGVCCDTACTGQCESCKSNPGDAATIGTCLAVTGAPISAGATMRADCSGTGACKGSCDGVKRDGCTMPGASTVCRTASCAFVGSVWSGNDQQVCNGAGACPSSAYNCQDRAPVGTQANGCGGATCTYECQSGKADCDVNGTCETNITTDQNCGACANNCGAAPYSTTKPLYGHCVSGSCQCTGALGTLCSTSPTPQCYQPSATNCCRPGTQANPLGCGCHEGSAATCGVVGCGQFLCYRCTYHYVCGVCGDPTAVVNFLDTRYPCGTQGCTNPPVGNPTTYFNCTLGP